MTKTVTSLFHSESHAIAATKRLEQAGIAKDDIDIWSTPHNLSSLLEDEGLSRVDAHAYAEGVIRGGSVIIVKCNNDAVDKVVNILDQEGVLDLDDQQAAWRSEGWDGAARLPAGSDLASTDQSNEITHGRVRIRNRALDRPEHE